MVIRTPQPVHPSIEEVFGYRWIVGFVLIRHILTAYGHDYCRHRVGGRLFVRSKTLAR